MLPNFISKPLLFHSFKNTSGFDIFGNWRSKSLSCFCSLISCHLSPYWYFLLISGKCTWFRTIFVSKFHAATIPAELTIHVVAFFNALVFIALFIHYSMYLFIQKIYILTSPGGSATYKIDKISNLKELT